MLPAVLSAGLGAAAFPPLQQAGNAWLALAPLVIMVRFLDGGRAAYGWGALAGMGFWLANLSWLLTLGRTGAPWPVAGLAWIALAAYCAQYTALFCLCAWRLVRWAATADAFALRRPRSLGVLVLLPLCWTGLEYARGILFTGFPWNGLGVSQYRNLALIQCAEWAGVHLVSALIVLVNVALALACLRMADVIRRRNRRGLQVELVLTLAVIGGIYIAGAGALRQERLRGSPAVLRTAAVQMGIPQLKKWPPEYAYTILDVLERQTAWAKVRQPDLIVWPETAVPSEYTAEDPVCLEAVRKLAEAGPPILVGSLETERTPRGETRLYNSAFLTGTNGLAAAVYRKRHLVPFGEYLPFDKQVALIGRLAPLGFSCWPGTAATVFSVAGRLTDPGGRTNVAAVSLAVLICFEDIMPYLARDAVRNGARLLVNMTNDAWFDGSAGALQHMSHSVFRCIEQRVPAIRAANTGITCTIERTGAVRALQDGKSFLTSAGIHFSEVGIEPERPRTLYGRYGDNLLARPAAGVALWVLLAPWCRRIRSRTRS